MTSVVVKAVNVAGFPDGGGHFWVFMQYAHSLRQLGCDVHWLERFESLGSPVADDRALALFATRMERFGLADRFVLYRVDRAAPDHVEFLGDGSERFGELVRGAELLLNFDYSIEPQILEAFRLSALVDIDPGLLQFWIATGQLAVIPHHVYLTIGEAASVGSSIPETQIEWRYTRRPVCLDLWPFVHEPKAVALTTVSGWWGGGGEGEWVTDGGDLVFENNKRVGFLQFVELPCRTSQALELALTLGAGDETLPPRTRRPTARHRGRPAPDGVTDYVDDATDRRTLERFGWRVRSAAEVAGDPFAYRAYVQQSRGEFSCAKPSCMYFANAWISDRTLCYLASGKPAIVQNTGPSELLPSAWGIFRFEDYEGALAAIDTVNRQYRTQSDAARDVAATLFDGPTVVEDLLDIAMRTGVGQP